MGFWAATRSAAGASRALLPDLGVGRHAASCPWKSWPPHSMCFRTATEPQPVKMFNVP